MRMSDVLFHQILRIGDHACYKQPGGAAEGIAVQVFIQRSVCPVRDAVLMQVPGTHMGCGHMQVTSQRWFVSFRPLPLRSIKSPRYIGLVFRPPLAYRASAGDALYDGFVVPQWTAEYPCQSGTLLSVAEPPKCNKRVWVPASVSIRSVLSSCQ